MTGANEMFDRLLKIMHTPIYASRLRELARRIVPLLRAHDRVLDVGCGFGALGRAILDHPSCPEGIEMRGIEIAPRGGELIPVEAYDGRRIRYADDSFDIVILADVLHHDRDPKRLIDNCARVAKRLLIIKDHKIDGPLAQIRVMLIDWAANEPYGVPCLYRYLTLDQWRQSLAQRGFEVEMELTSMKIYPPLVNFLFGGRLQYMAVLRSGRRLDSAGSPSSS